MKRILLLMLLLAGIKYTRAQFVHLKFYHSAIKTRRAYQVHYPSAEKDK